jgi:hypothetical protein
MPSAGSMRDVIHFERYSDVEQAWRIPVEYAAIPARVTDLGGARYEIQIRWRADLDTLRDAQPAIRIRYKNLLLERDVEIQEFQRGREVRITAEAIRVQYDNLATGATRHTSP